MQTVDVNIEQKNIFYPIIIGENAIENLKKLISDFSIKRAIVVTNETIFEIYHEFLPSIFNSLGLKIEYCILPDGEEFKNKTSLEKIITCAFEAKLERNDAFIAFGGGVLGDITGFAASIYLRGINFIQIPTTILAQVDSSVGGKVAIDTAYGKNLLGAFYQPKFVLSDLNFLKTLPERQVLSGLAEVLKYSFIEKTCGLAFTDFIKFLSENSKSILKLDFEKISQMISLSCQLKAEVVKQDEKENGLRAILNFGHTLGHALEKVTNYRFFTHGEAIIIGMKGVFLISKKLGKIDKLYYDLSLKLFDDYGYNCKIPVNIPIDDIIKALYYDKKIIDGKLRFILPVNYGEVAIFNDIDESIIKETIKELY